MKNLIKNTYKLVILTFLLQMLTGCVATLISSKRTVYSNPEWAPTYYDGVRYYYMPDIETYYDLSNQDFIYLDGGQWMFSNTLPTIYSEYDLYNGYAIALDIDVFEPWMHHHFYVSNYPRYYYHNSYHVAEFINIRGFNENIEKPFYTTMADRDRMTEMSKRNRSDVKYKATRQSQQSNYYGRNIGRHVKVQSQMREGQLRKQAHGVKIENPNSGSERGGEGRKH